MKTKIIKLSDIVIDAGTQQREKINDDIVTEYAEAIQCGSKFPAITTFFDGVNYYLVDGFHRYHAHRISEIDEIQSDVHEGTRREARLFSAGVNGAHGIRLTNADKRNAVMVLLGDEEWSQWSNRDIAKHCKVTHTLVNKMRDEIEKSQGKVETASTSKNKKVETASTFEQDLTSEEDDVNSDEQKILELTDAVISLEEENIRLKDAISINQLPEDEIHEATITIDDLRKQVKSLEAELSAVKSTRDSLYVKVGELEKQCSWYLSKLKKAGLMK